MSKKSDDSIERIFRQALTQYDTKFQEGDWLKMEQMLNEEASRRAAARAKRIKGTAYTLTGLTGLIIAVYFLAFNNPSGSIGSLSDSVTEMQASEALRKNGNVKPESLSDGLLSGPSASDAIRRDAPKSEKKESDKIEPAQNLAAHDKGDHLLSEKTTDEIKADRERIRKSIDEETSGLNSDLEQTSRADNWRNKKLGELNGLEKPNSHERMNADSPGLNLTYRNDPSLTMPEENVMEELNDKATQGKDATDTPIAPSSSGASGGIKSEVVGDSELSKQKASNSLDATSEAGAMEDAPDSTSTVPEILKIAEKLSSDEKLGTVDGKKIKPASRWSIGLILAPEFSTTSLGDYSAPGESFGLRIAYQLSNKFSINTGLLRSTKKYEGSGDSYKPRNPAYWQIRTNGVVPEEIYSKCLVYELPIGVQFDAIQTQKSRVFISTAVSSYFMASQAYDYTFNAPNPGADMGWRSPGSENYWFSVGMISAGYERYIHRSLAIGIEPYLKISLSEIGWPNVKLYSTGAYVTLRYRFMSK